MYMLRLYNWCGPQKQYSIGVHAKVIYNWCGPQKQYSIGVHAKVI